MNKILFIGALFFLFSCSGVTRNLNKLPQSVKKVALVSAICDLKIGTVTVESSTEGADVKYLPITPVQKKNAEKFKLNEAEEKFLNENALNIVNSFKGMLNYEIISDNSTIVNLAEKRNTYFSLNGYYNVKESDCAKIAEKLQVDGLFFIQFKMYRGMVNNLFFGKKYHICLKTTVSFYNKKAKKIYEMTSYSYSENHKNVRLPYFFKLDERNKEVYEEAFIREFDKMENRAVKRMKNLDKDDASTSHMNEYDDF